MNSYMSCRITSLQKTNKTLITIGALMRLKKYMRLKTIYLLGGVFFFLFTDAHAYIGPGAGFAVAGSFLVIFAALVSAILVLFTWPIRTAIRAVRFRKIHARSRIKRAIILGFDGMDYTLTKKMIDEGKLPHLATLQRTGCFKPLRSTIPPISPVAWSSFQTGVNPGKHNIFDFLTRDRATYGPRLSSSEIKGSARKLRIGKYVLPLGKPDIRLLRKSVPFWSILGSHGIFSSIIRVPITFPPEKFYGVSLSGMCVPDLRGSQGIFSYYTTTDAAEETPTSGEVIKVIPNGNVITSFLKGPEDPFLHERKVLTCPFTLTLTGDATALLQICGKKHFLSKGTYSEWIRVSFKTSLHLTISGICRFLLIAAQPTLKLYVTPIQIDPDKPALPISHPKIYATYLAKRQGCFATLGIAEDSWALNEKCITDADFLEQCRCYDQEREKMLFDALENTHRGICVCVFDGTDRVQHTFWRYLDPEHPTHVENNGQQEAQAIEDAYKNADRIVGRVLRHCSANGTLLMVISDHGFTTFRYGIDLNYWLEENGYLVLKEGGRWQKNLAGVDWSRTKAFALGLAGIYLNLRGREAHGIVDPIHEAPQLREEIAAKLLQFRDPVRNVPVIKQVYNAVKLYAGPYKQDAPDLIIGYHAGYRASWQTAVGEVTESVLHANTKAWSGDHCVDQSLVPGVLFCNRRVADEQPRLLDIGPTMLNLFGLEVPTYLDGRPLNIEI